MRFIISIEHQDFYLIFVTKNYIVSTQMNASVLIFSMSYLDTILCRERCLLHLHLSID